jgi:hypothetical protein
VSLCGATAARPVTNWRVEAFGNQTRAPGAPESGCHQPDLRRPYGGVVTLERRARPCELVDGDFLEGIPVNSLGRIAQAFARNLSNAIEGRSGRAFERDAGMSNAVVVRILKGQVWPDAVTIARLELATDRSLWPTYGESVSAPNVQT